MKKTFLMAMLMTGAIAVYGQDAPNETPDQERHNNAEERAYEKAEKKREERAHPIRWHRGYVEFGFNLPQGDLGRLPFPAWSVAQNILSGVYGAKTGFLFSKGNKYYFNPKRSLIRFGLDWTTIQFTYNEMNWDGYTAQNGGAAFSKKIYGFSTRFGPVMSWRPVGKLIVDLHFQMAPTLQLSAFNYTDNGDSSTFSLVNSRILHDFGWKTVAGFGVRWGVIGLGLDYTGGKINTQYTLGQEDAEGNEIIYQQKIKSEFLQFKLTLNF